MQKQLRGDCISQHYFVHFELNYTLVASTFFVFLLRSPTLTSPSKFTVPLAFPSHFLKRLLSVRPV